MTAYIPPYREPLSEDNNIRGSSTMADYAELRPAFDRKHGTVTAANSTPLTDGAAAVILMTESRAKELGIKPLGYLRSYAFTAIDVWQDMLLGPAWSTPLALERAGLTLADLTLIDMHEAFAAQTPQTYNCWRVSVSRAMFLAGRMPLAKWIRANLTSGWLHRLRSSICGDGGEDDHPDIT